MLQFIQIAAVIGGVALIFPIDTAVQDADWRRMVRLMTVMALMYATGTAAAVMAGNWCSVAAFVVATFWACSAASKAAGRHLADFTARAPVGEDDPEFMAHIDKKAKETERE